MFDSLRQTRRILLVNVPIAWLDEAAPADIALKGLEVFVTPYVILHIAKLPSAQTALNTDQHLSFAASLWVNNEVPGEA